MSHDVRDQAASAPAAQPNPIQPNPIQPNQPKRFDPKQHLIDLKGKDYLPVAARLVWLNEECTAQHWAFSIETEFLALEEKRAIARAIITITNCIDGSLVKRAYGTKAQRVEQFKDFLEKAETGAIGRALAILGFGTQFDDELDETNSQSGEPRVVDTPQPKRNARTSPARTNTSKPESDRFSEAQIKRTYAIAAKLFNLTGNDLDARVIEAAQKILADSLSEEDHKNLEGFGLESLHWRNGKKVMEKLEEQAVKRGVWERGSK